MSSSGPQKIIDVIDYGGGNIGSMLRCLDRLSIPYELTQKPAGDRSIILPGVGAFGSIMHNLETLDLKARLRAILKSGTPYLGICIGLQILFDSSQEAPDVEGLGVIPGRVVKYSSKALDVESAVIKIPQIGWNWIESKRTDWENGYVYFVNSYYPNPEDASMALYCATYGAPFTAAVQHQNVTAFQFHPEKSGAFGQGMIAKWYETLAS